VLAHRKDLQGTVQLWAKGRSDSLSTYNHTTNVLVVHGSCSVFDRDAFGLDGVIIRY